MRRYLLATFTFLLSSVVTLYFSYMEVPQHIVFGVIGILVLLLLLALSAYKLLSYNHYLKNEGKWFLLFFITLLSQLIIVSTGGIYSRFFILVHLFILGSGLFFSFYIALVYVSFTLIVIATITVSNPLYQSLLLEDPVTPILYLLSSISILPLSYLIAERYHLKDTMTRVLRRQIEVEDALLEDISDLIIITDKNFRTLSVNDAVEKTIYRSRVELLNSVLFDYIFLKYKDTGLLNAKIVSDMIHPGDTTPVVLQGIKLIVANAASPRTVNVQIKTLPVLSGGEYQISFIISNMLDASQKLTPTNLELAITKHQAMITDLRRSLLMKHDPEDVVRLLSITKTEEDILTTWTLDELLARKQKMYVDIAQLCIRTLDAEKDFAESFHVPLDFKFINFSKKDIEPLLTGNLTITHEQLTGPFFTVQSDIRLTGFVFDKLLTIAILLASTEKDPLVQVSIERDENNDIVVQIIANCAASKQGQENDIFSKYYGKLGTSTNLHLGSGLEGFLVKYITDHLAIPLQIIPDHETKKLTFRLRFSPNESTIKNSI
jgi:hypothetical protein